ncbi:MAG TPA: HIT domain-containing protein [Actinomycetota bacterium]|nr:HIT domain-containing protein [Actinomycetota bacterium]
MEYVQTARHADCFLCEDVTTDDLTGNYILVRSDLCLVVMNRFPYNTGHLLISPLRLVGSLEELTDGERAEVMELTVKAIGALRQAMDPEGFNLGANLGAAAGAGVPGHLHIHLVPRWAGDTNFMPVTAGSKVLPETIDQTYARLQPLF